MNDFSQPWNLLTDNEKWDFATEQNTNNITDAETIWWYEHNKYLKEERERYLG